MKNDYTIDILYNGYDEKFTNVFRPALVRVVDYIDEDGHRTNNGQWTLFVDAIQQQGEYSVEDISERPKTGIFILHPQKKYSQERGYLISNLTACAFDAEQSEDWYTLFWDFLQLSNLGVQKPEALVIIALNTNLIRLDPITQAIKRFSAEQQGKILQVIQSTSWSLSHSKISYISKLLSSFGITVDIVFPSDLIEAAKSLGIEHYERFNVFELADRIVTAYESSNTGKPSKLCPFLSFIDCINGSGDVPYDYYGLFFPYLDETRRPLAIKRYFCEIKKGNVQYSSETQNIFLSQNFSYYSNFRYLFEKWPLEKNVSTEFLFDCLSTYEKTKQTNFQAYNGILDWVIKESEKQQSLIELNFRDWLLRCDGGILLNEHFMGFADFQITYEFDEMNFEDEPLEYSIQTLIRRSSAQRYHSEKETRVDSETGKEIIDEKTGEPKLFEKTVYEDIWDVHEKWKPVVDLFVNWDIEDDFEQKPNKLSYSKKMIDKSIVREKVLEYSRTKFETETPTISYRKPNLIINMFGSPITMTAVMYNDTTLGVYANIMRAEEVIDNVRRRLEEIFGGSLQCEYDPAKLEKACSISLFNNNGNTTKECFKTQYKNVYPHKYLRYCSPNLSEEEMYLTGKRFASCERDICFQTCIQKEPHWQNYKLIHLLEILGYQILDKTDAGYIPIQTYRSFVGQINKAISFFKRLKCRECNHILFPVRTNPKGTNLYRNFKCMNPFCSENNKEIYLNYCFQCKSGIIDSRDTKKCPNGYYICPKCKSCCSNVVFNNNVQRYILSGRPVPARLAAQQGTGHKENNMFFCPTCGKQMLLRSNCAPDQVENYFCPDCERPHEENGPDMGDYAPPIEDYNYE